MEKSRKPKIRFKGYNDDWEQREFDEVFVEKRDKTERENEDTLLSCAINGIYLNSELFGHFRGATTIGYLKVNKNDLILSAQNLHLGNANVNLRFEHGIISPAYKVYDLVDCDPYFVHSWVKKDSTKNFFLCATTEGASQCRKNIEWHTLEKQTILMPVIQEQNLIGNYFQALDELITLHQRKLDKLVNVKKSMLEKMFPQQGSRIPEIRFSGFTEDWEQRKLREIATEMVAGGDIDKDLILDKGRYPVIANAITNDGIVGYYNEDYRIKAPAVTITGRGDVGHAKARIVDFTPVVRLLSLKSNHDVFFLENAINTLKIVIESTGVPQLTVPQLTKYEISFPKSFDEEEKIGVYFKQLDNLITLHQR